MSTPESVDSRPKARTDRDVPELSAQLHHLDQALLDLDEQMNGSDVKAEIGELDKPTIRSHLGYARSGLSTTYGPTTMQKQNLEIAKEGLKGVRNALDTLAVDEIPKLEQALQQAGAPWIVGQPTPKS